MIGYDVAINEAHYFCQFSINNTLTCRARERREREREQTHISPCHAHHKIAILLKCKLKSWLLTRCFTQVSFR